MQSLHEGQNFMETALDYVTKLWPIAVGFAGLIAWLIRVDMRAVQTAKGLPRVERELREEIARVENRIDTRRKEDMERIDNSLAVIMTDIKTLLQRGA